MTHGKAVARLRVLALPVTLLMLSAVVVGGKAHAAAAAGCSSFGPTWARSYNARAAKDGNPVRIVAACCRPPTKLGLSPCHIIVTLAGTRSKGCEFVHLDKNGKPVGPGKHEACA